MERSRSTLSNLHLLIWLPLLDLAHAMITFAKRMKNVVLREKAERKTV